MHAGDRQSCDCESWEVYNSYYGSLGSPSCMVGMRDYILKAGDYTCPHGCTPVNERRDEELPSFEDMNKLQIYEQLAEELMSKPLSTFRTKGSCVKCIREIINSFKDLEAKQKILDDGVFKVKSPRYQI